MVRLSTRVIEDIDDLSSLEPAWWDLWERTPSATPFQSPAWLIAWRRAFAPGPLCVSALFAGGDLLALAPYYREVSSARLLPLGVSLSDYLDVLVDPEAEEAAAALGDALGRLSWSSCHFEESPPFAISAALPAPPGCADVVHPQSACPVLALSGGPDLEGCVPARRRRQLRRAWTAARRQGEVRIETVHDSESFLASLAALHAARWGARGESGVLAEDAALRFHRSALPGLAERGAARCYVVTIGGRAAGAYYGFLHRGRAFAYLGGFDPAFEEASPGAILIGHAIAEAICEGAAEFHFLRGRESYKYTWGARDRWNQRRVWTRGGDD